MEMKEAPSGAFRYQVREAVFGDDVKRSKMLPEDQWTYELGGGATRTPQTSDVDKISVEVWLGVELVEIKNAEGEWEPLPVDRDGSLYQRQPFDKWLERRPTADILAMHQEVLDANPNWNRLGLPTINLGKRNGQEAS